MPLLALLFGAALLTQGPRASADTTTIYLAATTDVHGRASAWDYERDAAAPLGLARAATVIDSLRRAHPGRVVVVDAGDLLQGNSLALVASQAPRRGVNPMVLALNRIGYDAATLGNHEFNYPLPLLDSLLRGRRYALVSSNITRTATMRTPSPRPPWPSDVTVLRGGVRIGITGATTPGVLVWDGPHVQGRLGFRPLTLAVPPAISSLRRRGADVTVLVAHAGLGGPSSYAESAAPPENDVAAAIRTSGDIDVAVIGHTHQEIADSTVGTTLVVQPKNWAQSVAVVTIDLVKDGARWRIARKHGQVIPLANVRPDSALVAALAPWHEYARSRTTAPVATSSDAMPATRARIQDTPALDFVNEVMRARSGADLSATGVFSTAGGLPQGAVSLRNVVSIYPYDNTLKAVRISGAELRAWLEQSARAFRGMGPNGPIFNDSVPSYNFDVFSGIDYELDLSQPPGHRVAQLLLRGRDVRDADTVTVALNNYRQQGGGGFSMLARAPVVYDRNEDIRGLLMEELRRKGTIHAADYFQLNWRIRNMPGGPDGLAIASSGGGRDSIVLRVLATNDLHGALEARQAPWSGGRPVGGMAYLAGMMDRLEAECGCPTIRLDGGDIMQGSAASNLTHGKAMVDAANAMHLDAAAIGNHEFDWTIDTLAVRIHDARFAWLSANIREIPGRRRPGWAVPMTVVEAGGKRIAVVGYTTPGTTTSSNPLFVRSLGFLGAASVDSALGEARARQPDYVVLVAHEGAFCSNDGGCNGAIVDLANALRNKPDLIVSGHTHSLVNTVVNGIPIVQARSSGTALGIVDFVRGDAGPGVRVRVETVWADRERPDSAVAASVTRSLAAVRTLTERVIVQLAQNLPRSDSEGSALADMIADALREQAGADVALINNTGVRAPLWAGPVTWGQLYEVLPFGNTVVKMPVTGAVLRQVLQHAYEGGRNRAAVSGLRIRLDKSAPASGLLAEVTLADGRPLADDAVYQLATFDFLAAGGSGYSMLRDRPFTNTGTDELDAFIAWLQRQPQPLRIANPYPVRVTDGRP